MTTLLPTLISWLQLYGYPALWIFVFLASMGAPLPLSLVLLAAGAFAALGDFNIYLLVLLASSASVCGDICGYVLGRWAGEGLLAWVGKKRRFSVISPQMLLRSQRYFRRHGAWAIVLSRCVVPALGGGINLLAGAERYPFRRFLPYDIGGELVGAALPLLLGYIFGASWEAIGALLTAVSLLILALLLVIYLTVLLVRMLRRMSRARQAKRAIETEPIANAEEVIYETQD